MSFLKQFSWIFIAALAATVVTGGGWLAAWRIDVRETNYWEILAREEAATITETAIVALERAQRRVFSFARSLPPNAAYQGDFSQDTFMREIQALGMADPEFPFISIGLLAWVSTNQRADFLSMRGLSAAEALQDTPETEARFEAFIVTHATEGDAVLKVGSDLSKDEFLTGPVTGGFRAGGIPFTGAGFDHSLGRATPIATRQGERSVVLGLLDVSALFDSIAGFTLPTGMVLTVEERKSGGGANDFAPIFSSASPVLNPQLNFETRYAQGGVAWRFNWQVDTTFRGGPSSDLSDTLRLGSVLGSALLALIMGYANAARRGREDLGRERAIMEATVTRISEGYTVVSRNLRLIASNQHYANSYALPPDLTAPGTPILDIIHYQITRGDYGQPKDKDALAETLLKAFQQEEMVTEEQTLPTGKILEIRRMRTSEGPLVSLYFDVTEQRLAERERAQIVEALRVSEERYALAAAGANDGLWDWDLVSGSFYTSPRWQAMLGLVHHTGLEREEVWFTRIHPNDVETVRLEVDEHIRARTDHLQCEFRILHEDGDYIWAHVRGLASRDDTGKAVRITGSLTDITERKRAEAKLVRDALYDTVTGLPNRALFLDRIEQERRRNGEPESEHFAVLLFDLDRFKVVNDSLGHDVGDSLLIEVARRLEASVRAGDSVARISGDEFGVLLTNAATQELAQDQASWLQADLSAAFTLGTQEVFTSASVGIALPSSQFSSAEEMVRAADIAMYKAKEQGQSSIAVFHPTMQSRAITQMQLENDLRRAVDRSEIEMLYQPIIDLQTGKIAGVEALARWRHPDRGTVVPAEFIPLAEDTGLINAIGATALRLASRQMAEWRKTLGDSRPALMSVNLSSRQLQDPDMVREVELILARENVLGSELKLEVTESMIMMNPEVTSRLLIELKQLGVALSIDDFGTGYSSLSYLHRFPFDTLKIDRSFVVSMEDKTENMEIVRSIALLAHSLDMDIIAEGVETERHLARLLELGCEYGQGFYFSTPVGADDITAMIRNGKTWEMPATSQDEKNEGATLH